jgi:hypothetical protein
MSLIADVTAGNPVSASWGNALRDGSIMRVTAAEVASIVAVEGQLIYVTDEDRYKAYNGSAWVMYGTPLGWVSWTPTWTGLTLGSGGTNVGAYLQTGRKVEFYLRIVLGTSPLYASTTSFAVPTGTPAMAPAVKITGTRSAARWQWFPIVVSGSTTVQLGYPAAGWATAATGGQLTGTLNVAGYATATAADVLDISGWYVTT